MTPLMWAAFNNQPRNVARLLHLGADPEEKDMDGKTAWHWAVHPTGPPRALKLLLTHDRTFSRDAYGKTVAHCVCEANAVQALELVCALRPDCIADVDKVGRTPLHFAAAHGHAETVAALLRAGADPMAADLYQATPRDYVQAKRLTWVLTPEESTGLATCGDLLQQRADLHAFTAAGAGAVPKLPRPGSNYFSVDASMPHTQTDDNGHNEPADAQDDDSNNGGDDDLQADESDLVVGVYLDKVSGASVREKSRSETAVLGQHAGTSLHQARRGPGFFIIFYYNRNCQSLILLGWSGLRSASRGV
jgi:hypothetical protein